MHCGIFMQSIIYLLNNIVTEQNCKRNLVNYIQYEFRKELTLQFIKIATMSVLFFIYLRIRNFTT